MSTVDRLNGWGKAFLVMLPFVIAGLIAWGTIRSDVEHLRAESQGHATRETVDAQYAAILRELQNINSRLQRLEDK